MGHCPVVQRSRLEADLGASLRPVRMGNLGRRSWGSGAAYRGTDAMDFARGRRGDASSQLNACRGSIDRLAAFQSCELGSQDCVPLGKTTDSRHPGE